MKYFLVFSIAVFSFAKLTAQTDHYCAKQKTKSHNKVVSGTLPPGYVPPENKYDLKLLRTKINFM